MRTFVAALLALTFASTTASAQTGAWAEKLFKGEVSHDFGNVTRRAQLSYTFEMTNIYAVPLEIVGIRISCGCLTVPNYTQVLKPLEKGKVEVVMDTRKFTGTKSVNIFVTIGPKFTSTA